MNIRNGHRHAGGVVTILTGCFAASAALAQQAPQQEEEPRFTISGAAELGGVYNSNVSITELESATGQSDTGATAGGELDLGWRPTDRLTADVGYSYDGTFYQDQDEFDLGMHLFYGDLAYQFDHFSLGTNYYYADAALGGNDFLTMEQYSFYGGRLFAEQLFLRAALNAGEKTFDGFSERDADVEGLGLDAFWFFNQGRSSLAAGYHYEDEQARLEQFSYDGHTVRVSYSHRFPVFGRDARLQLGARMEERDYVGVTPAIATRRDDRQRVVDAELELPVSGSLGIVTKLERGDYSSNLASADYTENRVAMSVRYSF